MILTKKIFFRTIRLLILSGILLLALRLFEFHAIYFPEKTLRDDPSAYGLQFENISFETTDHQVLHGWFVPAKGGQDTVLFCHGNAQNISYRLEKSAFFHQLGMNVFLFDYRGYGRSQGRPSEQGLYRDVDAAYHYLISRGISRDRIIGYGESLGAAVMVDLAFRQPMKALVLEGAFTNIKDMAAVYYPLIPRFMIFTRFDSRQKIASIKIPKLMIHSKDDQVVPFYLGKKLFEAAAPPREFLEIRGGHSEGFYQFRSLIQKKLVDFLKTVPANLSQ